MKRSPRPIGRPRQLDNAPSTKSLILDEATSMYLDKGYQAVSMDDIAAQCDVTKATIYYHYKTKADLFTDAMVQLMLRIKEKSIQILSAEKPLKERLKDIAMGHLLATEDIDINRFMKEAKTALSDEQLMQMEKKEKDMYDVLASALSDAMDAQEVPAFSPILAAHAFMAYLTAGKHVMMGNYSELNQLEEVVDQIVEFYWYGLGS